MIVLHIEAYDWNCSQHITPRYTAGDIEEAFASQRKRILQLEDELKMFRDKARDAGL